MSIELPRRELLALINRGRERVLTSSETRDAFDRIEGVIDLYQANRKRKQSPLNRGERKKVLIKLKKALDETIRRAQEFESEFGEVADVQQIRDIAKRLVSVLPDEVHSSPARGPESDDRKWAIAELVKEFEGVTGEAATHTYKPDATYDPVSDKSPGEFRGGFFEFAKLCFLNVKPQPFETDIALGAAVRDSLSARRRDKTK